VLWRSHFPKIAEQQIKAFGEFSEAIEPPLPEKAAGYIVAPILDNLCAEGYK